MTAQAGATTWVLAHDLGTTGDKASLFRAVEGTLRIAASTTTAYPTDFGHDGRAEQSAESYWDAFCAGTRELLDQVDARPVDVACVSFSGQMMGAVLLDDRDRPVRPAIIWADTRSQRQCGDLVERIGMSEAYRLTGHRLNPTYSLSKLMWVRDHEPDTFARARQVVQAKDYVGLRLTGRTGTDASDASGMNAFDQRSRGWSEVLLGAAELDPGLFPPLLASTDVRGTVRPNVAAQCGLVAGTPVVVGGGDGPCAAVGAGVIAAGNPAYAYLGSSSWVSVAADEPLHDPKMRTMTFDHVVPGRFVPTATMQAGGAALDWMVDLLAPGADAERYDELLAAAGSTGHAGPIFLPHLLGERSPYWNPRARGAILGLQRHHGRGDVARAVLEGVAMNLYTGLKAFTEMGRDIDQVDAIGGAARSDVVLGILADVWGVPVRRRSGSTEANSLGAGIVGAVGIGLLDGFGHGADPAEVTRTCWPDDASHARHERRYVHFLDAYARLEPWFDAL